MTTPDNTPSDEEILSNLQRLRAEYDYGLRKAEDPELRSHFGRLIEQLDNVIHELKHKPNR